MEWIYNEEIDKVKAEDFIDLFKKRLRGNSDIDLKKAIEDFTAKYPDVVEKS